MLPGGRQYKAFISYSHTDSRWARRLHRFLENYRVPGRLTRTREEATKIPRRLGPVFRDRDELATASDLNEAAEKALAASKYLVVLCSPRSAASRWVNEEVLTFKRLGRADRILCIIIDGEPNASYLPGREDEECFCPALRYRLGDDGESTDRRVEPVAADARRQGDGWPLARLKLVAGLLDVGLDDLRQREMQRRNRRLAYITTASLAGMALTVTLAVTAINARDDAERRREQADDLISFMLGDLRERLNEVGRLDVLDSVTEKTMEYFAGLPASDLDIHALGQRAEALMQLGQVQMARGNLDAALSVFSEALSALQELSAREPGDPDRLFDLGQAHFWVGYVHWEKNELDHATSGMERYHDISERLYRSDTGNNDYLLELGYAYTNLAVLANRRGDREAVLDYSERSVALNREVLKRDPSNEAYRRALAESYSWNGTLLFEDLQLEAAERSFRAYFDLSRQALETDPDDSQWRDHFMLASRFIGDSALYFGRQEQADSFYRSGIAAAVQLLEIEPDNDNWQAEHAVLQHKRAQLMLYGQDTDGALALLELVGQWVGQRRQALPDDLQWKTIEADTGITRAAALRQLGHGEAADHELQRAAHRLRALAEAEPESEIVQVALARCLFESGSFTELVRLFESGALPSTSPQLRAMLVVARMQVGEPDAVASERAAMRAAGFRHPAYDSFLLADR